MSARAVPMDRGGSLLPQLPRGVLPLAALLAVLVGLALLARVLAPFVNPAIVTVRVDGALQKLDAARIVAASEVTPGARLFSIDLEAVRTLVEAEPWVAHARITRVWPDVLAIAVTERRAYARWGDTQLIDTESRVFTPNARELDAALPKLAAPEGHEAEVAATWAQLAAALEAGPFAPASLSLDARGEWLLGTQRGIELRLGPGDPIARLPMIEGVLSTTLAAELDRVAYIDLHHGNGFAVGWTTRACDSAPRAAAGARNAATGPACREAVAAPAGAVTPKSGAGAAPKPAAPKGTSQDSKR